MTVLAANERKRRGISAVAEILHDEDQASISVRGQERSIIMTAEHYRKMREFELAAAVEETRADIAAGRFKNHSIAEHIAEVTDAV